MTVAWAGEGDGSKGHPFTGVWQASELAPKLDNGKIIYLAYDCDIQNGNIFVTDSKLNQEIAHNWPAWSPGNVLGSSDFSGYEEYYKHNSLAERKSQLFLITDASASGSEIRITGYFSGRYDYASLVLPKKKVGEVEYYIINSDDDYETFRNIVATGNPYANAILEANITVTEPIGGGDEQFHYRGTFDGQGHTIDVDSLANDGETPWGVFQFTEPGCVIRNLKVTGTLTSSYMNLGSIVGEAVGTRIENCISDANLKNTATSTLPVTGGLIGACHGVNFVENCAFIGEINAAKNVCGIIGKVSHNVEIKSSYVDATFSNPASSKMFIDKTDDTQIFLNNYYHQKDAAHPVLEGLMGAEKVTDFDLTTGKLCVNLNINGRNGVVWYNHEQKNAEGDVIASHPYPFKGSDGLFVFKSDAGSAIRVYATCQNTKFENHICKNCGEIQSGYRVAPLQNVRAALDANNHVTINNLTYKINKDRDLTTAELIGCYSTKVKALHVPETIVLENYGEVEEYTIDYISSAHPFMNSEMEYIFIPKTVNHIDNNAFNNVYKLKYLHIADRADDDTKQRLKLESNTDAGEGLFYDCPLETVYIGRQLKWNSSKPAPFLNSDDIKNSLKKVYWGPRVHRIGNYYNADQPREGNCDAFKKCNKIESVFFMGDEQNISQDAVEIWMQEGLCGAKNYYVNRTIAITDETEKYVTYHDNGIFLYCSTVSFGPYVKKIGNFFGGVLENTNLKSVDLSNTFHLETIAGEAFRKCASADFNADMSKTNLGSIGYEAFYDCKNLASIRFGSKLQSIGARAFRYCEKLAYISIPGTVTTIDVDAFSDCESLLGVKLEDSDTSLERKNLYGRFEGDTKHIASVYVGREIDETTKVDDVRYIPFGDSRESLTSVEIGPKVKTVPSCVFDAVKALNSVSFDYSPEPLKFLNSVGQDLNAFERYTDGSGTLYYYNDISSLFIDRKLVDKDGNEIVGDKWGYLRKTVDFITFGEHVTNVSEGAYANFKKLNNLFIPRSMKTIGANAFSGSEGLKSLVIMGAPTIGEEAFANCTELETVIVNDGGVIVSKNAFANCNNIKDITLNSNGNTAVGADDAFSDDAYANTKLYSTFDTRTEIVVFNKVPWSKFDHPVKRNNDYVDNSDPKAGHFEHASISRIVNDNQYEVFYAPFQWDSYYFGSDAEIYSLASASDLLASNRTGITVETSKVKNNLSAHNIKVGTAIDLSENTILPIGIYVVKTNYSAEKLHATRNLFLDNDIYVYNGEVNVENSDGTYVGFGGYSRDEEPYDKADRYLFEDGVLKLLNGKHHLQSGEVSIFAPAADRDQAIFNINKNSGTTLFSSKRPIPIHSLLEGYATFYNEKYNVLAPTWCEVYVITGEENGEVSMEQIEDRVITAGQAVILKTNKPEAIGAEDFMTYVTDGSQATALYSKNLLRGVSENTEVDDICGGDGFIYVLSCDAAYKNTGFYKLGLGKTLGAGKAYLLPSDFSDANLAKACLFSFNGAANGITSTSESKSESDYIYDLSGKRINANQTDAKGVYIIDSKKVVK